MPSRSCWGVQTGISSRAWQWLPGMERGEAVLPLGCLQCTERGINGISLESQHFPLSDASAGAVPCGPPLLAETGDNLPFWLHLLPGFWDYFFFPSLASHVENNPSNVQMATPFAEGQACAEGCIFTLFIEHVYMSLAGCYSRYYIKNSYCVKLLILTLLLALLILE